MSFQRAAGPLADLCTVQFHGPCSGIVPGLLTQAFQGFLGAAGEAAPALNLPDDPLLSGHGLSAAAWTVSGSAVGRISNPLELAVQ